MTIPFEPDAVAYYADDQGFFTSAGVSVQIMKGNNGAAVAAAIASGAVDIGYVNLLSVGQAVASGLPFTIVFPCSVYNTANPTTVLMVGKNSSIHDGRDLNGKTIAILGVGGLTQLGPQAWINQQGGDAKTVHWIELADAGKPAALAQGRVDAIELSEPFISVAKKDGARVLSPGFDGIGAHFVTGAWITTRAWADAHSDVIVKLRAALVKTATWANAHPVESGRILAKYTGMTPETIATMARTQFPETIDGALLQPQLDAGFKNGMLAKSIRGADLVYAARTP